MIFTACDEPYLLAHGRALIRSCARHAPEQRFYLYLIGRTLPDEYFRGWHPRLVIERASVQGDPARWRALMCCARSTVLEQLLRRYHEPTLYVDADTLVRAPLSELWQMLETCDLMVRFRPERDKDVGAAGTTFASLFNNGVIAIRPSAAGLRLASEYNQSIQDFIASGRAMERADAAGRRFVIDQELLYVAYLKLKDSLCFQPLPRRFNDTSFKADGVIWHGKGTLNRRARFAAEKFSYTSPVRSYAYAMLASLERLKNGLAARSRLS